MPKPRLLDQVRQAIRTRHYNYRTEKAYVGWIKRFIFFHNKRHPVEMGEAEIAQFLSALARESHVSASTQNQALNALLFLYQEVLSKDIGYVSGVVWARRPSRLPVVLISGYTAPLAGFVGNHILDKFWLGGRYCVHVAVLLYWTERLNIPPELRR